MFQRSSGVLCHLTSLPGPGGIGDLGPEAYRFVDILQSANQHLWQVLPLGPAGGGDSPYDAQSSFAGNPLMISVAGLVDLGLLDESEIQPHNRFASKQVHFRIVEQWKHQLFRKAFQTFTSEPEPRLVRRFEVFCESNSDWLDDFALYETLREANQGLAWYEWPRNLRLRHQTALRKAAEEHKGTLQYHRFVQFLFDLQWHALKEYANERRVSIMGDVPIYVAHDSADVWANQDLFMLNSEGQPTVQAGVPPDLFSEDGQLWGNPVYNWDVMQKHGFRWWRDRIQRVLELTNLVRIDHFRGFAAGWQVPIGEETARNGEWVTGPGKSFFDEIGKSIGQIPIVVEDLGVITPDVEALRDSLGYPGMKVLQFAFGDDAENPYLPHNYVPNSMVYTGTHDNDTTRGWFKSLSDAEQQYVRQYTGSGGEPVEQALIRTAWSSVSVLSCVPVQDLLGLGSEGRMNVPGEARGNWSWRFESLEDLQKRMGTLSDLTRLYGRDQPPMK
jgi:4-alpha-glucanotransferase